MFLGYLITLYILYQYKNVEASPFVMLEVASFYIPDSNRQFYTLPIMYLSLKKFTASLIKKIQSGTLLTIDFAEYYKKCIGRFTSLNFYFLMGKKKAPSRYTLYIMMI